MVRADGRECRRATWWSASAIALALNLAAGAACKAAPEKAAPANEDIAHAEEKLNLLTNPGLYLTTSDREYVGEDGGDVEHQLTSLGVYNSSHFAVRALAGDVVWYGDQDRRLGSTPFTLTGAIAPGQARRFATGDGTMQSGKLNGVAGGAQVVFTHVQVVEADKGL